MRGAEIEAAKKATEDYLDVLTSTGRAIAAYAVRVPSGHRVATPDVVAAIERMLDRDNGWTAADYDKVRGWLKGEEVRR